MRKKNGSKPRIIFACAAVLLSLLPPCQPGARSSSISLVINEVMYDPIGDEVKGEWVELLNVGGETNIKDWTLTDQDGASFTFPDITAQHGDIILIYIGVGNTSHSGNATVLYINRTVSALSNSGDDILLVDSGGVAVDYMAYGSGTALDYPIPPCTWTGTNKTVHEGYSYALTSDGADLDSDENWGERVPTPGELNNLQEDSPLIISEVYYNSYRDNEYVKIFNPAENEIDVTGWALTDLEGSLFFPSGSIIAGKGCLVVAENSTSFFEDTLTKADFQVENGNVTPMMKQGVYQLKNDGDEAFIRNKGNKVVDTFVYGASQYQGEGWIGGSAPALPEGKVAKRKSLGDGFSDTNTSQDWVNARQFGIGQSDFQARALSANANVTAFVSPDSSYEVVASAIDNATKSILIALYELKSPHIAGHIINALDKGIDVRLLLEDGVVSGMTDDERYVIKQIFDHGGDIRLMINDDAAGIYERYRYMHAKYAIIDNETTIIGSENWGANGIPSNNTFGNRGWWLLVKSREIADYFTQVFFEDSNPARTDIAEYSPDNYSLPQGYFMDESEPVGTYDPRFSPLSIEESIKIIPVLSPDTSLDDGTILGMIRSAQSSIFIEQFYISQYWENESTSNPYLDEVVEASKRGVSVRILLDSTEYDPEEETTDNENIARYLNDIAFSEGLDMEARLFNTTSNGILKLHNKGMVVDGIKVLVSSINWNYNSVTQNRESGLMVENAVLARYFSDVFEYDWDDDINPPIVRGCDNRTIRVGEEQVFDASRSFDESSSLNYSWDVNGDGQVDSYTPSFKVVYDKSGNFTVVLRVTDTEGNNNISRCFIEVNPSEGATTDSWPTWIFYGAMGLSGIAALLYARKLSRRKAKIK